MRSQCSLIPHAEPDTLTRAQVSAIIHGEQCPLYLAARDHAVSDTWKDVGINDLLPILGPKKFLRLMVSPTGVFGFYDGDVSVDLRDARVQITPPKGTTLDPNESLEAPHIRFEADAHTMMAQWATKGPNDHFLVPDEHYYFRSIGGVLDIPRIQQSMPASIPTDRASLKEVNLYLSQAGTVTNLHYDPVAGAICQLKGRKRALLFPPDQADKFAMYPPDHFFSRRSRHAGRLDQTLVDHHPRLREARGFEYIVGPDEWLFLPKGWLHYIETLDDDTISLIVTFRA